MVKKTSEQTTRLSLQLYWQYVRRYPRYLVGIGALLPVTILMHQFLPPLVAANILNKLSNGEFVHGNLWASFGSALVLYTVLRVTSASLLWRAIIAILGRLEANVEKDIANNVFGHLLAQSPQFHVDRFAGTLVAQTTKFMSAYIRLAEAAVYQLIPLILSFIFAAIILLPKAPLFVIALLVFSIIYMTITAIATRKVRQKSSEDAEAQSAQTGLLADALSNIMAVKSFAATAYEKRRFLKATEHTHQKTTEYMRVHNARELYFSGITSSMTSMSLILATASVVLFDANIATAFLVLDYSSSIVLRLWQFSSATLRDINRAFGEATEMTKIFQEEPAIADPANPKPLRVKKGEVIFKSVAFTHTDARDVLFTDFSLHIAPGEKIGLVGQSGAGKTTFTKLLLRFADIDGGEILIDGQDIRLATQEDVQRAIAYVPQEPLLFHRTIRENIAYGNIQATDAQIVDAAKKAHAHEFINALRDGYDTLVGERGVKLSGGQRQRIAIARAILKDAPILVLDEATSALDSESEALIQDAFKSLMQGRTTIVIAHRLSTIQHMDRVVVMEEGRIIEQGTHRKLIADGGTYARLWRRQSGGFIEQ